LGGIGGKFKLILLFTMVWFEDFSSFGLSKFWIEEIEEEDEVEGEKDNCDWRGELREGVNGEDGEEGFELGKGLKTGNFGLIGGGSMNWIGGVWGFGEFRGRRIGVEGFGIVTFSKSFQGTEDKNGWALISEKLRRDEDSQINFLRKSQASSEISGFDGILKYVYEKKKRVYYL